MKIELELFIPERSLLLSKVKLVGDIVNQYNLEVLHIHNDPVFEICTRQKVNLNAELTSDMLIKVFGDREDVGRFSSDCLTLVSA